MSPIAASRGQLWCGRAAELSVERRDVFLMFPGCFCLLLVGFWIPATPLLGCSLRAEGTRLLSIAVTKRTMPPKEQSEYISKEWCFTVFEENFEGTPFLLDRKSVV